VALARDQGRRRRLGDGAHRRAQDFDINQTARVVAARYRALLDA
jgi:hypothetical protein